MLTKIYLYIYIQVIGYKAEQSLNEKQRQGFQVIVRAENLRPRLNLYELSC